MNIIYIYKTQTFTINIRINSLNIYQNWYLVNLVKLDFSQTKKFEEEEEH